MTEPARGHHCGNTEPDGWAVVCRLEDIVPNTGVCALVRGRQVAIFRLDDDSLYAIDNYDPFSRANVLSRGIVGDLKGELVVASPVYKQHFSLVSGHCLEEASVCVTVFPVQLKDGYVWVKVASHGEQLQAAESRIERTRLTRVA